MHSLSQVDVLITQARHFSVVNFCPIDFTYEAHLLPGFGGSCYVFEIPVSKTSNWFGLCSKRTVPQKFEGVGKKAVVETVLLIGGVCRNWSKRRYSKRYS